MKFHVAFILIDKNDEEATVNALHHTITGGGEKRRPHPKLLEDVKSLRKLALAYMNITTDATQLTEWTVSQVNITGDYLLKQSRAVITLSKYNKHTGKYCKMTIPQITMYPEKEERMKYPNADKITSIIESVINETWKFLNHSSKNQMALFPLEMLKVA